MLCPALGSLAQEGSVNLCRFSRGWPGWLKAGALLWGLDFLWAPKCNLPIFLRRLLRRWSFIVLHRRRMRSLIINWNKFKLNMRDKKKKIVKLIHYWSRLPRKVVEFLSWEILFKTRLKTALSNIIQSLGWTRDILKIPPNVNCTINLQLIWLSKGSVEATPF